MTDTVTKRRRKLDAYYTERGLTLALLREIQPAGTILECCAGASHIAQVLRELPGVSVLTNDVDPALGSMFAHDAAGPDLWAAVGRRAPVDWVITNPPFGQAEEIVPRAFDAARVGVAFLLRWTYLEPTRGRAAWLKAHKDHLRWAGVFNPRPQFRAGEINAKTGRPYGTDSATVAWFVWTRERATRGGIDFITDWQDLT